MEEELYTYLIKLNFSTHSSSFIVTSKDSYPDGFLQNFCEDILEGIENSKKYYWRKFLGIKVLNKVPVERSYSIEYIGKLKHRRLDYNIIDLSTTKNQIAIKERVNLDDTKEVRFK